MFGMLKPSDGGAVAGAALVVTGAVMLGICMVAVGTEGAGAAGAVFTPAVAGANGWRSRRVGDGSTIASTVAAVIAVGVLWGIDIQVFKIDQCRLLIGSHVDGQTGDAPAFRFELNGPNDFRFGHSAGHFHLARSKGSQRRPHRDPDP